MTIWLNGALIDDAQARISVFDHGLTVGDGVFETVKVTEGSAVRADQAPEAAERVGGGARPGRARGDRGRGLRGARRVR